MSEPESLTLPQWMRVAADVIDDVNTRLGGPINGHWRPSELRGEADQVEAEEREAAERQTLTDDLAEDLRTLSINTELPYGERWADCARQLIESGWHKGDAS